MSPEERINLLQKRVESLARENHRLREAQKEVHKFKASYPANSWYTAYLQDSLRKLEEQNVEIQNRLETYQKHYAKWGHFYTRYENERLGNTDVLCDTTDIHKDNQRYTQSEEEEEK